MLQKLSFHLDNYPERHVVGLGMLHVHNLNEKTTTITAVDQKFTVTNGYRVAVDQSPVHLATIYEVEDGIYASNSFNFNHTIENFTNHKIHGRAEFGKDGTPYHIDYSSSASIRRDIFDKCISPYGTADNVEQVKEYFQQAIDHPTNKIVISIVMISRKSEKEDGMGWRWHKWGEYIGTRNPQCEYLADEPEIESVMVFHAYMIK